MAPVVAEEGAFRRAALRAKSNRWNVWSARAGLSVMKSVMASEAHVPRFEHAVMRYSNFNDSEMVVPFAARSRRIYNLA